MSSMFDSLLAALARLMVARGVPFADLAERLKGHYVRAAQDQASRDSSSGKVTDSRLSVLTGLQRRDIARLRAFEHKPARANPLSRLVATWQSDPTYSKDGQPIPLPRTGPPPSFEALARHIRQDIHPRTMLDTLSAAGTVAVNDHVTLVDTAYVPLSGSDEQLAYLSDNTGDHLMAACENVQGATPAHFERAVHYTGLTADQVTDLDIAFRDGQAKLLTQINAQAARLKAAAPKGANHRFRAGTYLYATKVDPS
ncbi:DUF6502 family protein [uncultured Pelagimonas sp.]|uniref:DUF6502 family protein n=1 Tax=uncultured Pelagimonas sp. TaxID=1618102 RepID=UPI0026085F00|nr:DUF6502 family protein [uncultured Pelagimonas sp.]